MFSTDTSKYDANDGSNLISRKILCAELWRREDSMLEVACALLGDMRRNRNQSQLGPHTTSNIESFLRHNSAHKLFQDMRSLPSFASYFDVSVENTIAQTNAEKHMLSSII